MRWYKDFKGPDFTELLNVYRDHGSGTVERWDRDARAWVAVSWAWWSERLEDGDPTLEQITELEARRLTKA